MKIAAHLLLGLFLISILTGPTIYAGEEYSDEPFDDTQFNDTVRVVQEAQEFVKHAAFKIDAYRAQGVRLDEPGRIIHEANLLIEQAYDALNRSDHVQAKNLAALATQTAQKAINLAASLVARANEARNVMEDVRLGIDTLRHELQKIALEGLYLKDVESLLIDADFALQQAWTEFDREHYENAQRLAVDAKALVAKAASMKEGQAVDLNNALATIKEVEATLREAETKVYQTHDRPSYEVEELLRDAYRTLDEARYALNEGRIADAVQLSTEAQEKVLRLLELVDLSLEESRASAENMLREVEARLLELKRIIDIIRSSGLSLELDAAIFEEVEYRLIEARNAFENGRFGEAERMAQELLYRIPGQEDSLPDLEKWLGEISEKQERLRELFERFKALAAELNDMGIELDPSFFGFDPHKLPSDFEEIMPIQKLYFHDIESFYRSLEEYDRQLSMMIVEGERFVAYLEEIVDESRGIALTLAELEKKFNEVKAQVEESKLSGLLELEAEQALRSVELQFSDIQRALDRGDVQALRYIVPSIEIMLLEIEERTFEASQDFEEGEHLIAEAKASLGKVEFLIDEIFERATDDPEYQFFLGQMKLQLAHANFQLRHAEKAITRGDPYGAQVAAFEVQRIAEELEKELQFGFEFSLKKSPLNFEDRRFPTTLETLPEFSIREVRDIKALAMELVSSAKSQGVDVSRIHNLLDVAEEILNESEEFESAGDTRSAAAQATIAKRLFESIVDLTESVRDKASETEVRRISSDSQESSDIVLDKDERGLVRATARDHAVRLDPQVPRILYDVNVGDATLSIESEASGLIEFIDANEDGRIQSGEIQRFIRLNDLQWNFTRQSFQQDSANVVKSIYTTETDLYHISLVLWIYKDPTIQFLQSKDRTVVYSIEGNANEVKMDLIVHRWEWSSPDANLAMRVKTLGQSFSNLVLQDISESEKRLIFQSGDATFKVKWVPVAELQFDDGTSQLVNIASNFELSPSTQEIYVDFIYSHFGDAVLIHDPSVGLGKTLTSTEAPESPQTAITMPFALPLPLLIAAIATAVGITAFVAIRRNRKQ